MKTSDGMNEVKMIVENLGMRRLESAANAYEACSDVNNKWGMVYWGQVYSKLIQSMSP